MSILDSHRESLSIKKVVKDFLSPIVQFLCNKSLRLRKIYEFRKRFGKFPSFIKPRLFTERLFLKMACIWSIGWTSSMRPADQRHTGSWFPRAWCPGFLRAMPRKWIRMPGRMWTMWLFILKISGMRLIRSTLSIRTSMMPMPRLI